MQNKQVKQGRTMTVTGGVAYATLWAILITLAVIAILAKMVDMETLSWESVGYGIMLTLIVCSFIGSKIAITKIKRRKLLVCTITGIAYFCILLTITALFFGGNYYAVWETALLIVAGSGLAFLTGFSQHKRRKQPDIFRVHKM